MTVSEVECYAGSTYPERPLAFTWEGQRYEVQEVIDRRREPEGVGFLVRSATSDTLFDLFYSTESDSWQIVLKQTFISRKLINP